MPDGWRAVFGHFTSELHTTADIPLQVQCLGLAAGDREAQIATVTLAVSPDHCGIFTTNGAGAQPGGGKPNASAKPGPDATPQPQSTKPPKHNANPSPQPSQKVKPNKPPKGEATPTPRPSR